MKMSKIQLLSRLHFIIKDILNTQLLFRIFQLVFEKVIKETKIKTICRPNQFTTNCIVATKICFTYATFLKLNVLVF